MKEAVIKETPSIQRTDLARQTMNDLVASEDVFETFFDEARIGLALADLSTRYVRVNGVYADLLGRSPEELVGVPFEQVLHPDHRAGDTSRVLQLLNGSERTLQTEERYVGPDGQALWVMHGVTAVRDAAGQLAWFAVSAQDITERRHAEEELRSLTAALTERAVRDPLTGLANRALLEERLRAVLSRDVRSGLTTAVLFLDLDGFKAVNDKHGHAVGDMVLKAIATRLTVAVRPSDTVARLGGDEFVVLVEGATQDGITALVARLRNAVEKPIGDLDLQVGVSIGVGMSHQGSAEPGALLGAADKDMYSAKRGRRR